jgi:hypothetical protein
MQYSITDLTTPVGVAAERFHQQFFIYILSAAFTQREPMTSHTYRHNERHQRVPLLVRGSLRRERSVTVTDMNVRIRIWEVLAVFARDNTTDFTFSRCITCDCPLQTRDKRTQIIRGRYYFIHTNALQPWANDSRVVLLRFLAPSRANVTWTRKRHVKWINDVHLYDRATVLISFGKVVD